MQNLMREGGKKKNIPPIFRKVNEGDQIKNFWPILNKNN